MPEPRDLQTNEPAPNDPLPTDSVPGDSLHADVMEQTAMRSLAISVAIAKSGDHQSAREICAAAFFRAQPLIAARPALLRATLHAMLVARGFRLLSRMVLAISGSKVEVTLLPASMDAIEAPLRRDGKRGIALLIDPGWLDNLSVNDPFLERWSKELIVGQRPASPAAEGVKNRRQFEWT